jgi:hypothetical protein
VVVGGAGGPLLVRPGPGGDPRGLREGLPADEGLVGVGHADVAAGDVAGVGGVGEHQADDVPGPWLAGPGAQAACIEFGGDGAGAEPVPDVEAEDVAHHGCLGGVGDQLVRGGVALVAVGQPPAGPFALGGFGVHPGGDPVDDGLALEFGEHAQERPMLVEVSNGSVAEANATPASPSSFRRPSRSDRRRENRSTR